MCIMHCYIPCIKSDYGTARCILATAGTRQILYEHSTTSLLAMFEHGDLRDPSMVSWFSKRALLGLRLHQPQALVADDEDAWRERRPIAAKPPSCPGTRGSHTGTAVAPRRVTPESMGA